MTTTAAASGPLIAGDPAADAARRAGLRRMRTVATGLLVLAAVVYLLTRDRHGFLGFVNAGAEASMVGAIADWFAVTALFKHPLGLPVPHTALIPRRKDELGRSLEEFVGENFLQETIIRGRIEAAHLSERVGTWLTDEVLQSAPELVLALGHQRGVRDRQPERMLEQRRDREPVRNGTHHRRLRAGVDEAEETVPVQRHDVDHRGEDQEPQRDRAHPPQPRAAERVGSGIASDERSGEGRGVGH